MATVDSVVTRALKEIGVLAAGEVANGDDLTDAIEALNQMLAAWPHDGIKVPVFTLNSGETLPYPENHTDPIMFNLAVRLSGMFESNLRPATIGFAENGYRNLQNYYVSPPEMDLDDMLHPYYAPNRYFSP